MTPLVLRVSMGCGDRLPSGGPSARLPSYPLFYDFLQNIIHLPRTNLKDFVVSNPFQLFIRLYLRLPRSVHYRFLLLRIDFVTFRAFNLNIFIFVWNTDELKFDEFLKVIEQILLIMMLVT